MGRNVKPRVHSPLPPHIYTHKHTLYATLCTRQMPCEEAFQTKQIMTKQGGWVCVCVCAWLCECVFAVMWVCLCVSCRSPCQAIYKSKARQGKFLTGKTAGDAPDAIPILGLGVSTDAQTRLHSTRFWFQDFITIGLINTVDVRHEMSAHFSHWYKAKCKVLCPD